MFQLLLAVFLVMTNEPGIYFENLTKHSILNMDTEAPNVPIFKYDFKTLLDYCDAFKKIVKVEP